MGRFAMVNSRIPVSLRLMPRASAWLDSVNTCTEVFSNWRGPRRWSGLELRLKIIRYTDKLDEHSLDATAHRHRTVEAFLARLQAIPSTGFSDQDHLSHDLLVRVLQQRLADFDLEEYEMPINQQNGIHTSLADLPLSVPLDSVKHYEDYIARLHQIPRVLSQTTEVLRAGMKDKLMPVRFLLEKLPVQCEGIIDADPFLLPTKKYPATISPEDQKRLTQQITDAINTEVIPAYKLFADF